MEDYCLYEKYQVIEYAFISTSDLLYNKDWKGGSVVLNYSY